MITNLVISHTFTRTKFIQSKGLCKVIRAAFTHDRNTRHTIDMPRIYWMSATVEKLRKEAFLVFGRGIRFREDQSISRFLEARHRKLVVHTAGQKWKRKFQTSRKTFFPYSFCQHLSRKMQRQHYIILNDRTY